MHQPRGTKRCTQTSADASLVIVVVVIVIVIVIMPVVVPMVIARWTISKLLCALTQRVGRDELVGHGNTLERREPALVVAVAVARGR